MVFVVYTWLVLILQQEIYELGFEGLGAEVDMSIYNVHVGTFANI